MEKGFKNLRCSFAGLYRYCLRRMAMSEEKKMYQGGMQMEKGFKNLRCSFAGLHRYRLRERAVSEVAKMQEGRVYMVEKL